MTPAAPTPSRRRRRAVGLTVLALLVLTPACLGTGDSTDEVRPPVTVAVHGQGRAVVTASTTVPAPSDPSPVWEVGAELLPLRPDGLAEIRPTPPPLVDRRLPTPPAHHRPAPGERFHSSVEEIDEPVRARMGRTWHPGCPVGLDELRRATVSFWGFDGGHHVGELILHRDVVDDVVWVFGQLHAARVPLEEVRILTDADLDAPATGDGNVTAAYICRAVRGGTSWSEHAYGRAVDINPFHNPYQRGDVVLPERASAYLDREHDRMGMVHAGDPVTTSFAAIGWSWGGDWESPDYMHFSATGR